MEGGINLGSEDGRCALESLMDNIDLVILDNLSTLFSIRSEFFGSLGSHPGMVAYIASPWRFGPFYPSCRYEWTAKRDLT